MLGALLSLPLATAATAANHTISVGSRPAGVAVNPSTNTVYVANYSGNSVSVINGSTNAVTATISVRNGPLGVAVNPSTNTIYVANAGDDSISVVNGSTNYETSTIGVGSYPDALAVNPSTNTIYVANAGRNTVWAINASTSAVTAMIPVGNAPAAVAVNPSTNTVYIANTTSNSVSVINGSTNAVTATISVGSQPAAVAINPSTVALYVANGGDNTLSVIAPSAPSAPTITSTTAGSSQATLTWTDGAANGAAISSETIYVYAGATLVATKRNCSGSPCTVTGLTNTTSYTFKVSDTNAAGEGALSAASSPVIPFPVLRLTRVLSGVQTLVPHWSGITLPHGAVLFFTATATDLLGHVAGTCQITSRSAGKCRIVGLTGRVHYRVTATVTARIGTKAAGHSVVTSAPSNQLSGIPKAPRP